MFFVADALASEIIRKNIDMVTLGDYDIGKIIFLTTYSTGEFPHEYLPPVFNTCQVSVNFDGKTYKVNLIDTTGQVYSIIIMFIMCTPGMG